MKFDKQTALVLRLFKSTNEGKLEWKQSARQNGFQVSFPNYTIITTAREDDYFIELVNDEGTVVDVFSDGQLTNSGIRGAPYGGNWYQTMRELYSMARRAALGVDKALDDILKELGE